MRNFIQEGERIDYVNITGSAILSGDVVPVGTSSALGIAVSDIAIGATAAVALEGVYRLDKTTSLVITQGDRLYWNTSTKKITKTVSDLPIGIAFSSQLTNDIVVDVNLYGMEGDKATVSAQSAFVAQLLGTLTGTIDGTINDVAHIATAGGATPTAAQVDTAVNAAIDAINIQAKEIQTILNEALTALKNAGLMASA